MNLFRPIFFFSLLIVILVFRSDFSLGIPKRSSPIADDPFIHNKSGDKRQKDWSSENIVTYHWRSEPDNLHPTNGKSNPRRVILEYTQRFLVNVDLEKLCLRPDLVKYLPIESADGFSYSFELMDGVTWDDGSPLTVDDVVFTLKANKCPLTNNLFEKPYLDIIEKISFDRNNPKLFTLFLRKKNVNGPAFLVDIPIISRKYFDPQNVLAKYSLEQFDQAGFANVKHDDLEKWATEFNDSKYGTDLNFFNGLGAYKVTQWENRQQIELTKKKKHWTSKLKKPDMYNVAYPDKIIFKINVDDNSIALEFKKQSIDVSTWVSTNGLVELQKDSDFNRNYYSAFVPNFNYQYIGMNLKPGATGRQPFFTDKRVRRAMALLTPLDQMNQMYLQGKAVRQASVVSPIKKEEYDQSLELIPFDIEKAKVLLDEAGWKDTDGDNIRDKVLDGTNTPFAFELLIISGNTTSENMAKDMQLAMQKAGIKVNIRAVEFITFYEQVQAHKFDMYMGAWAGTWMVDDFYQIWDSSSWADGSNYVGFGNEKSDDLIDSISTTFDKTKRIGMEKRFQEMLYDEQPYIFMYSVPTKIVIHKRFAHNDMYFDRPNVYLSNLELLPL